MHFEWARATGADHHSRVGDASRPPLSEHADKAVERRFSHIPAGGSVKTMSGHEFEDLVERDRVAASDDERAAERDEVAAEADGAADHRDRVARDSNATAPNDEPSQVADERRRAADDRSRAANDRRRARQDREASQHDRWRAGEDRGAAHDAVSQLKGLLYRAQDDDEVMLMLGQAQGMIMAARDATPLEALLELSARAAKDHTELGAAADAIVREANRERERGP